MKMYTFVDHTKVLSIWILIVGSINNAGLQPRLSVGAESLDTVKVSAVSGGEAVLPCDTHSPQPPDALLLIVWYKDDIPIYSYDGRVKGPSAHWADDSLGGRAKWHSTSPTSLKIRDVVPNDRALYRCRIDFKVSPTKNDKIILEVIELPEKPKIFDEQDREINGVAGPNRENSSLKLTCVVSGGKPMPRLRWWRDDKVLATLAPLDDGSHLSVLELRIEKLTRDYLEAIYTCTADNTPLVPPLRVNVQIQLYLWPLLVEMLVREQPLSVGQEADLACRAVGARPPAVITWWLDGKQLTTVSAQKTSLDGNETASILKWTPRMDHGGRILACRASHAMLEKSSIETTLLLDLHYAPIVNLQLGSKLNPNDIEEGDDVYFECIVRANPPAYKVVWEHNGQIMTHNQRAGVIAGSAHLALQGVARDQSGSYVCTASNVEGDGKSAPVGLQVIYKPVCANSAPVIVGSSVNEAANAVCIVDAFPPPKNYQWVLNNTAGVTELEPDKFTIDISGRSVLSFTPASESDFGTLSCKATNLAGQQVEPCQFLLLPAVKPDPPKNCTAVNLTDDSVELKCFSGNDGGLATMFVVEVWQPNELIANSSQNYPTWKLRDLGSGKALKLIFYAYNARGRSEEKTLRIHTLSRLALHTAKSTINAGVDISWALGIISGILGTLTAITLLALLARKRHHRPMRYEAPLQTVKPYKSSIQCSNHSPIQPDDKNPDVVPLDFSCTRETERLPEPPPYGAAICSVSSKSNHNFQQHDTRPKTPHTPMTPLSDAQSIGTLTEDRRSLTSGTLSRRREVVTTRTPLLAANARESCV